MKLPTLFMILTTLVSRSQESGYKQLHRRFSGLTGHRRNSVLVCKQPSSIERLARSKATACPFLCYCRKNIVKCSGHKLRRIPKVLKSNIQNFKISRSNLSRIKKSDFEWMFSLRELHLGDNRIRRVDNWSFEGLKNLKVLNLTNNRLRRLSSTALIHLVNTKELYLDQNLLVNVDGVLNYMGGLLLVGLSRNRIRYIGEDTFRGNTKVTRLDLRNNLLRFVHRNAFAELRFLRVLLLNHNPLAVLELSLQWNLLLQLLDLTKCHLTRVLKNTPTQLKNLRLGNNKIASISEYDFFNPNEVVVLQLSKNRIQKLSDHVFTHMPHLRKLNINQNNLKSLSFFMPKKIYSIHASHNKIQVLNSRPFKHKYQLKYVFLSFNNISRIEAGALNKLPTLKKVDLSHNNIKEISSSLFWRTTNLEVLDLSFNPIHVFEANCFLSTPSLHILKASSIPPNDQLQLDPLADLGNLRYLDISYSPSITAKLLSAPHFGSHIAPIQYLNIMCTGLVKLSRKTVYNLKNLSYVNMGKNPWRCNKNILWVRDWIRDNFVSFYEPSKLVCHSPPRLKNRMLLALSNEEVKKTKRKKNSNDKKTSKADGLHDGYLDMKKYNETMLKLQKYIYLKRLLERLEN